MEMTLEEKKSSANLVLDNVSRITGKTYTEEERNFNIGYLVGMLDFANQECETKSNKKIVYVKKLKKLEVQCLINARTGLGFFHVSDEKGNAYTAEEIEVGGTVFKAGQRTRRIYLVANQWVEQEAYDALPEFNGMNIGWKEIPISAPLPIRKQ